MKILAILLLTMLSVHGQNFQEESLGNGKWAYTLGDNYEVPRYFICGAEMTQYRSMRTNPEICTRTCRKEWWEFWKDCKWTTECRKAEDSIDWIRSDNLRITVCNYIKWTDQKQHAYTIGSVWPRMGMKMCPVNQFVYGFQTKMNMNDGFSGLNLLCRNPKNASEKSQVIVQAGNGMWGTPRTSTGFGYYVWLKMDSFLTGLNMQFRPIPIIYNVAFAYATGSLVAVKAETIDTAVVINRGNSAVKQTYEFNKTRNYQRIWMNDKNYLHGQNLTQLLADSYDLSTSINAIGLSVKVKNGIMDVTIVPQYKTIYSFEFGTAQKMTVGLPQKDEIEVKGCTKRILKQIVYTATVNVAYNLSISYTNGDKSLVSVFPGQFKGVITSDVETTVEEETVC